MKVSLYLCIVFLIFLTSCINIYQKVYTNEQHQNESIVQKENSEDIEKDLILIQLKDVCGLMPGGNGISHTIGIEEQCNNACNSNCLSSNMKFNHTEFQARNGPQCNLCNCFCLR